jgi:hypothetical protein
MLSCQPVDLKSNKQCCEHVACSIQTSRASSLLLWHNTQETHVATMLQPVLCNIQYRDLSSPPSRHKTSTFATLKFNVCNTNITCLQHRDSTSAASKINVCNIEKFRSNFETFAWDTRNISRTQMQHVHNGLQHN